MIRTNIEAPQREPRRCVLNSLRGWLFRLLAIGIASAFLGPSCLHAQRANPSEYEVKAAYLYDFGKFVAWPANVATAGDFPICVLGEDPFGASFDATIAGETINGKKVVVNRIVKPQEA